MGKARVFGKHTTYKLPGRAGAESQLAAGMLNLEAVWATLVRHFHRGGRTELFSGFWGAILNGPS